MKYDLSAKTARLNDTVFWAEKGLVRFEDQKTGAYDTMSVRSALHRLQAISDLIRQVRSEGRRTPGSSENWDAAKIESLQRFVEDMIEVCREAQNQGMPSDLSARSAILSSRPSWFVGGSR